MDRAVKTISIGVIALNEEKYLPILLDNILQQTYTRSLTEIILVDGMSIDNTKQIMLDFQNRYSNEYIDVKVFDNPRRIQSSGWNIVLNHFTCDALLRIDAHAELPSKFLDENIQCLNSGEYVCGGPRTNIIDSDSLWKQSLLHVEQSLFGSGVAEYRRDNSVEKKYVNSLFHGAYRREVIEKVGLFNEQLLRTEDNEYHYRIRQCGYQICYSNSINSYYQTRNTLSRMIKQKYGNGLWIGKTFYICPKCLSLFHFIPFVFLISLFFGVLYSFAHSFILLELVLGSYFFVMSIGMFFSLIRTKNMYDVFIPALCFVIHVAYGFGTLKGLLFNKLHQGY